MNSLAIRGSVHWVSNYEITEAAQPIAPIWGILRTLRSNQWLVLAQAAAEEKTEFFPFRKRELIERFGDAKPFSIASEVLHLGEHGATAVKKRVWRTAWNENEPVESSRMVLVDDQGSLLGIGVPRGQRQDQGAITSYLKSREEFSSDATSIEETALTRFLRNEGPEDREEEPRRRQQDAEPPSLIVPVFYGTDRKRDPQSPPENIRFTNERASEETVSLGVCSVSIPKSHEIGKLERPPKWKIWARPRRNDHVMLLSTIELSESEFREQLSASVLESAKRDVFIFVHGYNVSFADAALRTAQLATDLSFHGGPIMFSWPSKGKLADYLSDEGAIQWSRPHLKTFIEDICKSSNANAVHLIAHSMGSRALVEVVQALSTSILPAGSLKQLIFAAPDVDSGVFQQAAKTLRGVCSRVTLYASDQDKALKTSRKMHGYARAGEAGAGLVVVAGVDTVDASLVDTDFLGHSGFATDVPLMQDVYYLVQHGHAPGERFGLEERSGALGTYWCFKS